MPALTAGADLGPSAAIVLADESPNNQLTPFDPDHPLIPTSAHPPTSQRISAPYSSTREYHISADGSRDQTAGSSSSGTTQAQDHHPASNSRRRRRSPSTEGSAGGESVVDTDSGQRGLQRGVVPSDRQRLRDKASTRKRRRLGNKTMRLDPDTSNSNGSRRQSNGSSLSPVQKSVHSNGTNGHSSTNGASSPLRNGSSPTIKRAHSNTYYGHDRQEVTRLLIQGLGDLGYFDSADSLSRESGFKVETPSVAAFRHAVLQGEWAEAEALLFGLNRTEDGGGVSISNGDSMHHEGLEFPKTPIRMS